MSVSNGPPDAAEPPDDAAAATIMVMIVEDHRLVMEGLVSLLGRQRDIAVAGFSPTAAGSVAMALTLRPDVILMDHVLPDGKGLSVASEILSAWPTAKVIMVTAFDDDELVGAAIDAGCLGFVSKGQAASQLINAIRRVAAGEPAIPAEALGRVIRVIRHETDDTRMYLTPRELEILAMLAKGLGTEEIAATLVLSPSTVRNHTQNILTKLGAHSKLQAVAIGVRAGLVRIA